MPAESAARRSWASTIGPESSGGLLQVRLGSPLSQAPNACCCTPKFVVHPFPLQLLPPSEPNFWFAEMEIGC